MHIQQQQLTAAELSGTQHLNSQGQHKTAQKEAPHQLLLLLQLGLQLSGPPRGCFRLACRNSKQPERKGRWACAARRKKQWPVTGQLARTQLTRQAGL